ncbi:MAG: bifunctional phosphoribosyl-AMP cyclohydrolase/phosphoribosyl-ATP diphosphatase HisIE [Bacteroidales bacterium]|nr:bifunctional phosphoribosyl-AMP cyclohydrolase/phosphoribosyl-ATP diphosphatase HisIE [Bacteroidales bacterium]
MEMNLDFEKMNGLIPAIIQDAVTQKVLMLGFMNQEAYQKTLDTKLVTFYSRTRNKLWTKGEESGNFLDVVEILPDCDNDTLLIKARPRGPVCHTGHDTCFDEKNTKGMAFIDYLQHFIQKRKQEMPENSYTTKLFSRGINRMAQKVGEEAVEVVIESKDNNGDLFLGEAADLIYHLIVLLTAKGFSLDDVANVLESRHKG